MSEFTEKLRDKWESITPRERRLVVVLAVAIPTVLIWRESILWVAFMSLYANFVGHFSGWDAARAEQSARENNREESHAQSFNRPRNPVAS